MSKPWSSPFGKKTKADNIAVWIFNATGNGMICLLLVEISDARSVLDVKSMM